VSIRVKISCKLRTCLFLHFKNTSEKIIFQCWHLFNADWFPCYTSGFYANYNVKEHVCLIIDFKGLLNSLLPPNDSVISWSYQTYGKETRSRSAEDIAFHAALFIAKGGSFVNYYMVCFSFSWPSCSIYQCFWMSISQMKISFNIHGFLKSFLYSSIMEEPISEEQLLSMYPQVIMIKPLLMSMVSSALISSTCFILSKTNLTYWVGA